MYELLNESIRGKVYRISETDDFAFLAEQIFSLQNPSSGEISPLMVYGYNLTRDHFFSFRLSNSSIISSLECIPYRELKSEEAFVLAEREAELDGRDVSTRPQSFSSCRLLTPPRGFHRI